MNSKLIIASSFAVTLGVISYMEISKCKEAPWPPRIIGTGIVFGMISLAALLSEELASVFAVGFVLAALVSKGFSPNCGCPQGQTPPCKHPCATAQPSSYQSLAGPSAQQQPGQILA